MGQRESRTYRVREFAELAGVTVRALHHYDRLGLLKPRRTDAGYRVYTVKDLETLEQIVALKFVGLTLADIKALLRKSRSEMATALRAQRGILERKKLLLGHVVAAIEAAEAALRRGAGPYTEEFRHIIEVIEMQNKTEDWKQQYDSLVQGKIERLKAMSPEARAAMQKEWTDLLKDVHAALDDDPAGARAQGLADRWIKLLGAFAPAGVADSNLVKEFGGAYSPVEWPAGVPKLQGPAADPRIWDFMRRAIERRR
jgi:DNA-binding transcriptional MerR regulator